MCGKVNANEESMKTVSLSKQTTLIPVKFKQFKGHTSGVSGTMWLEIEQCIVVIKFH